MTNGEVVFLGTGDAFSAGGRQNSAYLVRRAGASLLIDCGAATLGSLKRHSLSVQEIDTIVISHLHGDHIAGLPFLFLHLLYVEPRSAALTIIGPPGVESRVRLLFGAMYSDTAAEPLPFPLDFIEAQHGLRIDADGWRIVPFRVPHQDNPPSFGYEIGCDDRKIVYSGDSGWTEEFLLHTQGADLFICECSFFETRLDTHLDYPRILENLGRFGSKRIVLTHLGQEVLEHEPEVSLEMAHDGLVISL